MKYQLPKHQKTSSGFTLVELLVVISIIAILAIIGFTVFQNTQKGVRDAVRKANVEAISKALEVNYNYTTARYQPLNNKDFAAGSVPVDPLYLDATNCGFPPCYNLKCPESTNGQCRTCIRLSVGAPANACSGTTNNVAAGIPTATGQYMLCANLEVPLANGNTFYCKGSQR